MILWQVGGRQLNNRKHYKHRKLYGARVGNLAPSVTRAKESNNEEGGTRNPNDYPGSKQRRKTRGASSAKYKDPHESTNKKKQNR